MLKQIIGAAAIAAALAAPSVASAHTASVSVACDIPQDGGPGVPQVTFTYKAFNPRLVATPTEAVALDGVPAEPPFGPWSFTGAGVHVVALAPVYGPHTLTGTTSVKQDGRTWTGSGAGEIDCGVAPPPPPPAPPAPPQIPPNVVVPPPPPPQVLTCADLTALYPKSGAARRASWGCPTPPPPRTTHRRTVRIVKVQACVGFGTRPYVVRETRIVWSRGGHVIKVKRTRTRTYGAVCRPPEVTG